MLHAKCVPAEALPLCVDAQCCSVCVNDVILWLQGCHASVCSL